MIFTTGPSGRLPDTASSGPEEDITEDSEAFKGLPMPPSTALSVNRPSPDLTARCATPSESDIIATPEMFSWVCSLESGCRMPVPSLCSK